VAVEVKGRRNIMQAGDVVKLKSGGPLMTIKHLDSNGSFWCEWFADFDVRQHTFKPTSLKVVT
jgi:uncharacterized protein YodC (DUF2158 family)